MLLNSYVASFGFFLQGVLLILRFLSVKTDVQIHEVHVHLSFLPAMKEATSLTFIFAVVYT